MKVHKPLYIFTIVKRIFDTITQLKCLHEIRLMNEIANICRAYKHNKITNVTLIRLQQYIVGDFTWNKKSNVLLDTLQTGKLEFTTEQWICKEY